MGRPPEEMADKETYVRTFMLHTFTVPFGLDLQSLRLIGYAVLKSWLFSFETDSTFTCC